MTTYEIITSTPFHVYRCNTGVPLQNLVQELLFGIKWVNSDGRGRRRKESECWKHMAVKFE